MWPEDVIRSRWMNFTLRFGLVPIVLFFYVTASLHFSYTPDDTYIYLQYARNIADGNGFSFNAGEPTYGVTGPLWALLIAAGAVGGLDPYIVAKTLDLLFGGLAVIVALRLSLEVLKDPFYALCASALVATDAWLLRWTGSGLETMLGVLLVLLTFFYVYRTEYGVASLAAALLTLVRPEGGLLFLLIQADNLINTRNWRLAFRVTMKSGGVYLAVITPWLVYAMLTFGKIIPDTLGAKTFAEYSLNSILSVLRSETSIILATQALALFLLLVGVIGALRKKRRASLRAVWIEVFPLAWPLALLLFYTILNVQVVSRHLLLISPILAIFGVWGVKKSTEFWKLRWQTSLGLLIGLVAISGIQNQVFYISKVVPHLDAYVRGMEECLRPMAYEIRKTGGSVLTPDIGLVGYVSGAKVHDTAGIISPEVKQSFRGLPYDEGMEQKAYRDVVQPDFIIDRFQQPGRLESEELREVMHCQFPSLGLMIDREVFYTLYIRGKS